MDALDGVQMAAAVWKLGFGRRKFSKIETNKWCFRLLCRNDAFWRHLFQRRGLYSSAMKRRYRSIPIPKIISKNEDDICCFLPKTLRSTEQNKNTHNIFQHEAVLYDILCDYFIKSKFILLLSSYDQIISFVTVFRLSQAMLTRYCSGYTESRWFRFDSALNRYCRVIIVIISLN